MREDGRRIRGAPAGCGTLVGRNHLSQGVVLILPNDGKGEGLSKDLETPIDWDCSHIWPMGSSGWRAQTRGTARGRRMGIKIMVERQKKILKINR